MIIFWEKKYTNWDNYLKQMSRIRPLIQFCLDEFIIRPSSFRESNYTFIWRTTICEQFQRIKEKKLNYNFLLVSTTNDGNLHQILIS